MVTGKQLKLARVSIDLSVDDVTRKTSVSWAKLQKLEKKETEITFQDDLIAEIVKFYEENGVEFIIEEKYQPYIRKKISNKCLQTYQQFYI